MAATLTASPALESEGSFVAEVRQLVADDRFSGVVLGASGPDAEPWVVYGGMADVAEGRPIARDSVFGIPSMTKMFTAVAIGQWVAAGRADWDDPVGRFLPELTAEWSGTITIRHLLTHTSGLGDYLDDPAYLARRGTLRWAQDYLGSIDDPSPTSAPGERFNYSNAGFILLGAVVEAVSERPYWDAVQEGILTPAGMSSTYYLVGNVEAATMARLVRGYTRRPENTDGGPMRLRSGPDGSLPPLRPVEFIAQSSAAGGAFSTVDDLLNANSTSVAERLNNRRITPETIEQWQAQARLVCQVPELRGHDAQILVACGVTEPEQLSTKRRVDLFGIVGPFADTTEGERIVRGGRKPDLEEVTDWIRFAQQARSLRSAA